MPGQITDNLAQAAGPLPDYKSQLINLDNLIAYVDSDIEDTQRSIVQYERWLRDYKDKAHGLMVKREALVVTAGILRTLDDNGIAIKPKVLAKQVRGGPTKQTLTGSDVRKAC